jgi:hypothetical protein
LIPSALKNVLSEKRISLKWLIGLSCGCLLILLTAGLKHEGFLLINKASWISEQPGIRFNRHGIAFTKSFNSSILVNTNATNRFSIAIALNPANYQSDRFNFILVLHNGKDSEQLVIGQWRSHFIVMNGDDYAHNRKTKRITVDVGTLSPQTRLVSVTSSTEGTRIYLNGVAVRNHQNLMLKIPSGENTRLLLGNSVYAENAWQGDICGLALYNYPLSSQKAAHHYAQWSQNKNFLFAKNDKPRLLYLFDEKKGKRASEHSGSELQLEIPSRMRIPEKRILVFAMQESYLKSGMLTDIFINLVGFMPFGFILLAVFMRLGGAYEKQATILAVAFCFSVSLGVEILQAWIPSRSSHVLDLVMNILGAWMGTLVYRFLEKQIFRQACD